MDYDLFQSDDDEDILTAFLQATQPNQHQPEASTPRADDSIIVYTLPEFNCTGPDNLKTHFSRESFIRNGYAQHRTIPSTPLDILNLGFEPAQLQIPSVLEFLLAQACKNIQLLYMAVAGQQQLQATMSGCQGNWRQKRSQVTHCYHLLLHGEHIPMRWRWLREHVTQLRQLLNNVMDSDMWRVLHFAENSKGNDCQAPAYHLYHGLLEWRLLDLCVFFKHEVQPESEAVGAVQALRQQMERNMDELVLCGSFHYRNLPSVQLIHQSGFMCRCIKECWLLIQHLASLWLQEEGAEVGNNSFWDLFHSAMLRHKASLPDADATATLGYHEFYAWLRLSLLRLNTYNSMGELATTTTARTVPGGDPYRIAASLQQFLGCQPSEQQRRVYLCLLAPLQLGQWCQPSTEALCQLWECLHKSLNWSFGTDTTEQLNCANGSAYLERYVKLLAKPHVDDLNLSSFTIYTLLLGKTLPLLATNQRQKLLGRIFSKFSAAKLLALNEAGINHIIELFLCLLLPAAATDDGGAQLFGKLRELLLCLALDKLTPPRRVLVAKGHMALLELQAQRQQPLADYIAKLMSQLAAVRNDPELGGIYAQALMPIFSHAADDFTRGEHLLLGPWLGNFMEHSAQSEQDRVWQALHELMKRLHPRIPIDGDGVMWAALQQFVLPLIRHHYATGYSLWLPKLAAQFATTDATLLNTLLVETQPLNMTASAQLVRHIVEIGGGGGGGVQPTDVQVLHAWVKSLVLLNAQHEAVAALTPHVRRLEQFRALSGWMESSTPSRESREPLCAFFGALDKQHQQRPQDRLLHSQRLHSYVQHFEVWLPPERLRAERLELGARFFSFLAIVIYNCPTLAYVRAKPNCFFHTAMARFLLPTQLQAGQAPEGRQVQLVHKIFPVLMQGIGRLAYKTDKYLSWAVQQLVLHWTPHFGFTPNARLVARPYFALLQADKQGELAQYILEQLVGQFLAVQRRQAGPHAGMAVAIVQQIITGIDEEPAQMLTLLRATHVAILEHIMFVDELEHSRNQLLGLYRVLVGHAMFQREFALREACTVDIRTLAEKHMAHCTYFYFQMLIKIAEITPTLIAPLLPFIREKARDVELKRGAGEDVGIRKCLARLQQVLLEHQITTNR